MRSLLDGAGLRQRYDTLCLLQIIDYPEDASLFGA